MLSAHSERHAVGDSVPVRVYSFQFEHFHSVVIKSSAAAYVGAGGVSASGGFSLSAGESLSFSHFDFDHFKLDPRVLVEIWAISESGIADISIFGFEG